VRIKIHLDRKTMEFPVDDPFNVGHNPINIADWDQDFSDLAFNLGISFKLLII